MAYGEKGSTRGVDTRQAVNTPPAPVVAAAKIPKEFEMEERKGAEFISWDTPGTRAAGIFVNLEKIEMTDKKTGEVKQVPRITVQDPDTGKEYSFLTTYDLSQKLRVADKGKFIEVQFEGYNRDVVRDGNPMKVFRVAVSKNAANVGALKITDEDIPF